MDSITRIRVAYALRKQGIAVKEIAWEVERDRATVYRWLKGIRQWGKLEDIGGSLAELRGSNAPHLHRRLP